LSCFLFCWYVYTVGVRRPRPTLICIFIYISHHNKQSQPPIQTYNEYKTRRSGYPHPDVHHHTSHTNPQPQPNIYTIHSNIISSSYLYCRGILTPTIATINHIQIPQPQSNIYTTHSNIISASYIYHRVMFNLTL